jgi:hypothetical protein
MNEEEFEALKSLMEAIAYEATGQATHQPRCERLVRDAEQWARQAFDLPPIQDYE